MLKCSRWHGWYGAEQAFQPRLWFQSPYLTAELNCRMAFSVPALEVNTTASHVCRSSAECLLQGNTAPLADPASASDSLGNSKEVWWQPWQPMGWEGCPRPKERIPWLWTALRSCHGKTMDLNRPHPFSFTFWKKIKEKIQFCLMLPPNG